ncbi:MAG: bifunctional riboflavin kinase/FAD synthetase [Chitinophagia bacterium]|nr:bifunctional riboflavin kinase/FAD synthetase [Chitinophagia bacterium]
MQVHFQIETLPVFKNAVVTIGAFDGVHAGHQEILRSLKYEAEKIDGETIVITFHPHPRRILNNADAPSLLTSLEERIEKFQELGIDHLVVVPFDHVFAELSAEEYLSKFLIGLFHPKIIVIGYDHRFGKERKGDFQYLKNMADVYSYQVFEIPEHVLNESRVSSTQIREFLLNGQIEQANKLLTYPYQLHGIVIEGDKLGRTLGYPTANLSLVDSDKLIPASGVYAVTVQLIENGEVRFEKGMMNIGYRPTVNGKERRIEVHIFSFDEDIYHKHLKVSLLKYTRKEMKFSGIDALINQLHEDKNQISKILENINPSK